MKFFLVFAALFVAVLSETPIEWVENSKVCTQKSDVTDSDVQKALKGEIKPADVNSNLKCFFLCMTERAGITKDAVIQPTVMAEKIATYLSKDEQPKAMAACKDIKGTDNCDTGYKLLTCIVQLKGKA